ncbi:hypothetical protein [Streptomyces sp. NPDC006996]|uniref:hypothetical protein n=1 Tax=Streptomyces sp. NPDC006996 TaxID=3156908 RepID=UPI0033C67EE3
MLRTRGLFDSVTTVRPASSDVLARAIGVRSECEEAVTVCAAGMLAGKDADELRAAIVQDLDCADVTAAARRVPTRGGHTPALLTAQVEACLIACRLSHGLAAGTPRTTSTAGSAPIRPVREWRSAAKC